MPRKKATPPPPPPPPGQAPPATPEEVAGPLRDEVARLQARAASSRQALELRSAEDAQERIAHLRRLVLAEDWEAIRHALAKRAPAPPG